MKKLVLVLSLAIIAGACKKNEPKSVQGIVSNGVSAEVDCKIFDTLKKMRIEDQVNWLQKKQDEICTAEYDHCRTELHKITEKDFDAAVAHYWDTKPPVYTDIKIGDIESLTPETKYGKFISTSKNSSDQVVLNVVNDFSETPSCYSLPLFYSLERVHHLTPSSELSFTFGKIKNLDVVIFSIKGGSDYYDMSNCPL